MSTELTERRKFETGIIEKAWKDPAFRKKLVEDPKGTLSAELKTLDPDAEIPKQISVKLLEESPEEVYFVLPLDPSLMELDESDLDEVVGGGCTKTVSCSTRCVIRFGCGTKSCGEEASGPTCEIDIPSPLPKGTITGV